jgi:putative NADH-flavin reductase
MMKVIVFGANGGIGRQVVARALATGHSVTAVARRPETVTVTHPHLTVKRGDVLRPAELPALLAGGDAIVSAIGVASREPTTLYSDGVGNLLAAMPTAGLRRIMCISATGIDPGPWLQRVIAKPLLWAAFHNSYTDLVRMEARLRASPLDWTIVRPPRLNDKPPTGQYAASVNEHLPGAWLLTRADLADYLVAHLSDPATYRAWVEVAN